MRLVIHYLERIDGIDIYPIIGLIIFFSIFAIMVVYTIRLDKASVEAYKNIPLEDEDSGNIE